MDFYDATDAKKYARNRTRIIKEINDIEENILQAVDSNKFECNVYNTVMTDERDMAEPIKDAKSHCVMQLSSVKIHENEDSDGETSIIENDIYGGQSDSEFLEEINGGLADSEFTSSVDGGYAELIRKNYFRVGETMVIRNDENLVKPIKLRVSEVNLNGDIINFEILDRGEYTENILENADLEYEDMTNWLDIDSNYALQSDLQITRDGEEQVRDLINSEVNPNQCKWYPIGEKYTIETLPPSAFGSQSDLYIIDSNKMYVKYSENNWLEIADIYDYESFRLPLTFGELYCVCYNVFGKTYVKNECGWNLSPRPIIYLNHKPTHNDGLDYDIAYWEQIHTGFTQDGIEYTWVEKGKSFKNCNHCWVDISREYDWLETPPDNFGKNLDIFNYPEGNYRVKVSGKWVISPFEHRFDQIYLDDSFGNDHDIITYTGELEPYTTYVKIAGHWNLVNKVWNLNDYLLGRLPVNVDLLWNIKYIVMDDLGLGYMYPTSVVFSDGNATALVEIINEKIINTKLLYGGDDYTSIPEINYVMEVPTASKKYYKVWKQMIEDDVAQDEMQQVINYFEKTKKYSIARVTNENTGNTFYWHIQWN